MDVDLPGAPDVPTFWDNLRKAVANGLPESTAINALTSVPAAMLNVSDQVGSLQENARLIGDSP